MSEPGFNPPAFSLFNMPGRLSRRMRIFAVCVALAGLAVGAIAIHLWQQPQTSVLWVWMLFALMVLICVLIYLAMECVKTCLYMPLQRVVNWAGEIRQGNLAARITNANADELSGPVSDINRAAEWLEALAVDKEEQLGQQKYNLERKSRALQLLHDVATGINYATEVEQLTARFMYTVADVVGAVAASARLVGGGASEYPVAQLNIGNDLKPVEAAVARYPGLFEIHSDIRLESVLAELETQEQEIPDSVRELELMVVPLQYLSRVKGVYLLFIPRSDFAPSDDTRELLGNIGRQLGMAVEKARLDVEAHLLPRMQERAMLANELHDSLAQTLASLRFQVRVLDDTLHHGNESAVWAEMERVETSLEEANIELRELIRHFRAPVHKGGLVPAIQSAVTRFRKETRISTYFQNQWGEVDLDEEQEVHVLRIVTEALSNIRKHSGADNVRVLLTHSGNRYRVLIEDDGEGFESGESAETLDDHFGMSIMQERAANIGGELRVESEAGEGTRILLDFSSDTSAASHQV